MEALEILAQRCETIVVESVLAACRDKKDDMHIRYDNEANTMYVNFGVPVPADDSELGKNDILYRYKEGEVIGVTVTQALLSLPTNLTPPPHFRMS